MVKFLEKGHLKKLEFIITNSCNLNCSYCYAGSGKYNHDEEIISDEVIEKTHSFLQENDIIQIDKIVFFGGEPLIAIEKIEKICELFNDYGNMKPVFSMITNLTLLNESAIKIIKKYNIIVTVSLDGPKFLNDRQRFYINSNDSVFDKVVENIHKLEKNSIKISSIEATSTDISNKYFSQRKLANYLFNHFENIDVIQICGENNSTCSSPQ